MAEKRLIDEIAVLAGIPQSFIAEELKSNLEEIGTCPEKMTLSELREALARYAEAVLIELAEKDLENGGEKQEDETETI